MSRRKKTRAKWTAAGAAREAVAMRDATHARLTASGPGSHDFIAEQYAIDSTPTEGWIARFGLTREQFVRAEQAIPETVSTVAWNLAAYAHSLGSDNVYALSPEMLDITVAAARTLSDEDVSSMDILPHESGIVVLPTGLRWSDPSHPEGWKAQMVSWGPAHKRIFRTDGDDSFTWGQPHEAVRVVAWGLPPRQYAADYHQLTGHMLSSTELLPLSSGTTPVKPVDATPVASAREESTTGEAFHHDHVFDPSPRDLNAILFAFVRLLEQKTASESPMPTKSKRSRACAAARSIDAPGADETTVRVVNLAKRRSDSGEAENIDTNSVEWKNRWVVRMHKRLQPYGPGSAKRKVIFVGPYVKGPEDKPLKKSQTVNVLR